MAKKSLKPDPIVMLILAIIAIPIIFYLLPIVVGAFIYFKFIKPANFKLKPLVLGILALVIFGFQSQVFATYNSNTIDRAGRNLALISKITPVEKQVDIVKPVPKVLGVSDQPAPEPKQETIQTPQIQETKPTEENKVSPKPESSTKPEPKSEPKIEYHLVTNLKKCLGPNDREYSVATDFKSFSSIDDCQKELAKLSTPPNTDNNPKNTIQNEVEQPKSVDVKPIQPKQEPTKYRLDKIENLCYDSTQDKYNTLTNFTDFNTYGDCVVAKYNTPAPSSTSGSTTSSSSSSSSGSTQTPTQPDSKEFIEYEGNGGGPTLCKDGKWSHSSGRGTCSGHGGIAR